MTATLQDQLARWLAATDIGLLELRGPSGLHLRLARDSAGVHALAADTVLDGAPPARQMAVQAPSVGLYLHRHPLHDAPLAAPGQAVRRGQPLGLLRIGALLLPVPAPAAGIFVAHVADDGARVGYGTPLAQLGQLAMDDDSRDP